MIVLRVLHSNAKKWSTFITEFKILLLIFAKRHDLYKYKDFLNYFRADSRARNAFNFQKNVVLQ